jgi:hypothetical protein
MDCPPRIHKDRVARVRFIQQPPLIRAGHPTYPGLDGGAIGQQIYLRFPTLTEYMNVRRIMVVDEHHEPESECVMHRDHWQP